MLIAWEGLTGSGIARDAALLGWTVGLTEKEDFAFGTSSRSSKIVHSGIRYLEYGHFLLVKDTAQERAVLRKIAPHLVHPLPFVFPVFSGESTLKIRAGLTVFEFLAASEGLEKHEDLSPEEVREQLPGLRDPLKERCNTRSTSPMTHGSPWRTHSPPPSTVHWSSTMRASQDLRLNDGRVSGCSVVDLIEQRTVEVSTKLIVNATGAWSAGLLAETGLDAESSLIPSKGIHVLFSVDRLPITGRPFCEPRTGRRVSRCGASISFMSGLPTMSTMARSIVRVRHAPMWMRCWTWSVTAFQARSSGTTTFSPLGRVCVL